MNRIQLSSSERAILEYLLAHAEDTRHVRRAEAILWLDEEYTPAEIADQLFVSVQTIYNWAGRYSMHASESVVAHLADRARSGRPPSALGKIDSLIAEVIDTSPEEHGVQSTVWAVARSATDSGANTRSMSRAPASLAP